MLTDLIRDITQKDKSVVITPTDGSHKAYFISELFKSQENTLVVIVKDNKKASSLINELNFEGKIQPFTEASTILQDYMDAWILWKQYSEADEGSAARYSYSDFLFNVVAKRAIFISANIQ